ncbi:MAG: ubiquinol-cytochrome c reductase iron-sulfur subunit [Gemmatimonadales bacterium]
MTSLSPSGTDRAWQPGFGEYLLGGIVMLFVAGMLLASVAYLLPPEHLQLAELQPAFKVAEESKFPVSASRVVNWGDEIIMVIRTDQQAYTALEAVAPNDGCILRWDPTSLRVLSPCSYLVYDLHGNVVRGLTTIPLRRYAVFVRDGVVYVARS